MGCQSAWLQRAPGAQFMVLCWALTARPSMYLVGTDRRSRKSAFRAASRLPPSAVLSIGATMGCCAARLCQLRWNPRLETSLTAFNQVRSGAIQLGAAQWCTPRPRARIARLLTSAQDGLTPASLRREAADIFNNGVADHETISGFRWKPEMLRFSGRQRRFDLRVLPASPPLSVAFVPAKIIILATMGHRRAMTAARRCEALRDLCDAEPHRQATLGAASARGACRRQARSISAAWAWNIVS